MYHLIMRNNIAIGHSVFAKGGGVYQFFGLGSFPKSLQKKFR